MTTDNETIKALRAENAALHQRVTNLEQVVERYQQIEQQFQMFQTLVEHSVDGIILTDMQGCIVYANPAILRMGRYDSLTALIDKDPQNFFAPEEHSRIAEEILPHLLEHGCWKGNLWVLRADGTRYLIHNSSFVITDASGKPCAMAAFVRDITSQYTAQQERERLYQELKRQTEELHTFYTLVENAPDGINVADLDGKIIYANPAYRAMMGYGDEIIGRSVSTTIAEDNAYLRKLVHHTLKHESWCGLLTYQRKDGTTFRGQVSSMVLHDCAGTMHAGAGIVRDMTGHLQLQEALRDSQTLLQGIVDSMPAMISVRDRHGNFLLVNHSFAAMFQSDCSQIIGTNQADLFGIDLIAAWHKTDEHVIATGRAVQSEEVFPGEDGPHTYLSIKFPLYDARRSLFAIGVTSTDITNRKRAEEVLRQSNDELELRIQERTAELFQKNTALQNEIAERQHDTERLNHMRERLQTLSRRLMEVQEAERHHIARELHDDIGQSLTALKISLQTIQRGPHGTAISTRLEECISIIDHILEHVRNISRDLRPSLLDDLGLHAALRWFVDRQAQLAGFAAELITEPLVKRLSPSLETTCFRLTQEALTNIVRHARASRVFVTLRQNDTDLCLTIRDNGVGFDVHTAQERAVHGMSMGLLGMQERVLLVGGEIEIVSKPAFGTEIRARFPLSETD